MDIEKFLNELSLLSVNFVHTYITETKDYPMKNANRVHHGFLYTITGTETYHFHDRTIEAIPGSVIYIPKNEAYKITLTDKKSVVLGIDFEISNTPTRPFRIVFPEVNSIYSDFLKSEAKWTKKEIDWIADCKASFYKIVGILLKQVTQSYFPKSKYAIISKSVDYLHANYLKSDFCLKTLSEIAGISPRYFELLFKELYRMSPKEYILSLKIEQAKEFLLSEKLLIKDIAFMLGYNDIYHFGKIFKAKTGYTPSEYRHSCGL